MITYEKGKLRLTQIYNIMKGLLPVKEGLGVEYECSKEGEDPYYIVLAFIRPEDCECVIESVGLRPFDYLKTEEERNIFEYFCREGNKLIQEELNKDEAE